MLRRPPVNLNRQSEDATIQLIRDVLDKGMQLTEVLFHMDSRETEFNLQS